MTLSALNTQSPFDEIRNTLAHITPPNSSHVWKAPAGWTINKSLAQLLTQLCTVQDRETPRLQRVRVAALAGGDKLSKDRVAAIQDGSDPLNALCQTADAELRVYELDSEQAIDETALVHALSYGMMAVEPGLDAILPILINNISLSDNNTDFSKILLTQSRLDLAGVTGMLIAAALANVPVLMDDQALSPLVTALINTQPSLGDYILDVLAPFAELAELPSGAQGLFAVQGLRGLV